MVTVIYVTSWQQVEVTALQIGERREKNAVEQFREEVHVIATLRTLPTLPTISRRGVWVDFSVRVCGSLLKELVSA
jgi:hypothetical protein